MPPAALTEHLQAVRHKEASGPRPYKLSQSSAGYDPSCPRMFPPAGPAPERKRPGHSNCWELQSPEPGPDGDVTHTTELWRGRLNARAEGLSVVTGPREDPRPPGGVGVGSRHPCPWPCGPSSQGSASGTAGAALVTGAGSPWKGGGSAPPHEQRPRRLGLQPPLRPPGEEVEGCPEHAGADTGAQGHGRGQGPARGPSASGFLAAALPFVEKPGHICSAPVSRSSHGVEKQECQRRPVPSRMSPAPLQHLPACPLGSPGPASKRKALNDVTLTIATARTAIPLGAQHRVEWPSHSHLGGDMAPPRSQKRGSSPPAQEPGPGPTPEPHPPPHVWTRAPNLGAVPAPGAPHGSEQEAARPSQGRGEH